VNSPSVLLTKEIAQFPEIAQPSGAGLIPAPMPLFHFLKYLFAPSSAYEAGLIQLPLPQFHMLK
jgi:hypothetical protein